MNMVKIKIFRDFKVLGIALVLAAILVVIPVINVSSAQSPGEQPTSTVQVLNITFSDDTPMESEDIIIATTRVPCYKAGYPLLLSFLLVLFLQKSLLNERQN